MFDGFFWFVEGVSGGEEERNVDNGLLTEDMSVEAISQRIGRGEQVLVRRIVRIRRPRSPSNLCAA